MSIILWFIWNGFFVFYLLNILRNLPNVKGTWGRPSPSVPQSVCFLFAFSFFAWPSGFSFFLSLSPLLFFLNLTCPLFSTTWLFFFPRPAFSSFFLKYYILGWQSKICWRLWCVQIISIWQWLCCLPIVLLFVWSFLTLRKARKAKIW